MAEAEWKAGLLPGRGTLECGDCWDGELLGTRWNLTGQEDIAWRCARGDSGWHQEEFPPGEGSSALAEVVNPRIWEQLGCTEGAGLQSLGSPCFLRVWIAAPSSSGLQRPPGFK